MFGRGHLQSRQFERSEANTTKRKTFSITLESAGAITYTAVL